MKLTRAEIQNRKGKVLPFRTSPEAPVASRIVVQIGNERFAIHWEIEELPPAPPMLFLKGTKKATAKTTWK